eukprot:5678139-Lingulodinium_polyedra.AAC.1
MESRSLCHRSSFRRGELRARVAVPPAWQTSGCQAGADGGRKPEQPRGCSHGGALLGKVDTSSQCGAIPRSILGA